MCCFIMPITVVEEEQSATHTNTQIFLTKAKGARERGRGGRGRQHRTGGTGNRQHFVGCRRPLWVVVNPNCNLRVVIPVSWGFVVHGANADGGDGGAVPFVCLLSRSCSAYNHSST